MGSVSSSMFTGGSAYSQDFQNVVSRAVAIASLPLTPLNNDQATLTAQTKALSDIDGLFTSLQTAVQGLSDAFSGSSYDTVISDTKVLSATVGAGTVEGNYTVKVVEAGAYATSQTSSNWNAATGAALTYSLYIGSNEYDFTPADNSAASVAAAVNSKFGDKVHATVVSVGTASNPDTRISLQAVKLGDAPLNIRIPGTDLQAASTVAGGYATSQTAASWVAPSGAAHTYQLFIGDKEYDVTGADNTATGVAAAINAAYGDKVAATAVNLGDDTTPDWRIQLKTAATSYIKLDLRDAGASGLQSAQVTGKLAQYEVNSSGKTVSSDTRHVTIATGLTVQLLTSSTTTTNITVSRSTSALSNALVNFVNAYNTIVDELDAQRGSSGALNGQTILPALTQSLTGLATYVSDSSLASFRDLGVVLDKYGKLSFNQMQLIVADMDNPSGVTAFFGSAKSNGFLKWATDTLDNLEDPLTGLLKTTESETASRLTNTTNLIAEKQSQIDLLQIRLQDQMASANALISSMEQHYNYVSSLFQAMQDQQNK